MPPQKNKRYVTAIEDERVDSITHKCVLYVFFTYFSRRGRQRAKMSEEVRHRHGLCQRKEDVPVRRILRPLLHQTREGTQKSQKPVLEWLVTHLREN